MDVKKMINSDQGKAATIFFGVVLLALVLTTGILSNSPQEIEERGVGVQATPLSSSGSASTSTADGRVIVVRGGKLNDTFNIFASFNKNGDSIRALDCSNGTGLDCILVFDK